MGEENFGDGGVEVLLAPGAHPQNLLFRLTPAGVISGTVRDADGVPIMDAAVVAVHPGFFDNRRQLFPGGEARTDDRGAYRIYPLLPGKYTVMVNYQRRGEDRYVTYLPTFFPGTPDPHEAQWIDLAPGQEVAEIDVSLTEARGACVRGSVTNLVPSKNSTVAYVRLIPVQSPLADQLLSGNYGASTIGQEGEFQICGVPPGDYIADADYGDGEKQYRGRTRVDVASGDINGVSIPLAPSFNIHGRVRTDLQFSFDFSRVSIWLHSTDQTGGGAGGKMEADGTFVLQDVYEGNYRLQIAGYEEFYVKSAQWAGTDVLEDGLKADPSQAAQPLDVLLSANGGRIDGAVMDGQKPVAGAVVAFVPEPAHRQRDELYSLTRTDAQGRFSLRGLPPGDFALFAFEKLNPFDLKDPEFLRQYARYAKAVHVRERQQQSIDLELISPHKN